MNEDIQAYEQTDRHAHHNAPLHSSRSILNAQNNTETCKIMHSKAIAVFLNNSILKTI